MSLYGHYTGIIINIDNNYKCLKKNLSYFYDDCNPNHDLFKAFSAIQGNDDEVKKYASILLDEALLLEGRDIEDRAGFVQKINELFIKAMKE